jgi:hypothetical protein
LEGKNSMHLYNTTRNYHSYKIRELVGMVKMIEETSLEDEMSTVLKHLRLSAVIFVYEEICCIDDFAAAFNELKEKRLVTTDEKEMLLRFFTNVGISRDDTNRMGLH